MLQLFSFITISISIIFWITQGLGYITHDDFLLSMTTRGEKLPGSVIDNMLQVVDVQFANFEQDSEMCQSNHASGHEVQSGSQVLVPSLLPGRALSYSTIHLIISFASVIICLEFFTYHTSCHIYPWWYSLNIFPGSCWDNKDTLRTRCWQDHTRGGGGNNWESLECIETFVKI